MIGECDHDFIMVDYDRYICTKCGEEDYREDDEDDDMAVIKDGI